MEAGLSLWIIPKMTTVSNKWKDRSPGERAVDLLVLLLSAAMVAYATIVHEPWLDEAQHWCLARDSSTLADLWRNTAGEGHPPLWHWTLWLITRFTTDLRAMHDVHALMAIGSIGLLVFASPLPRWVRWLAPFGYFLAYEYAAIARNYTPAVLLLFVVCALHRDRKWWWRIVALALLALTHYWGLVAACAYLVAGTLSVTNDRGRMEGTQFLLFLPFALLSAIRIWPAAGSPYGIDSEGLFSGQRLGSTLVQLGQAWWPWANGAADHPWNGHLLLPAYPIALAAAGVILSALAYFTLPRHRGAQVFFILTMAGVLLFPWLTGDRGIRYTGPVLIAWLAAQWMAAGDPIQPIRRRLDLKTAGLLVIQVIGTAIMLPVEFDRAFSNGRALVQAVRANGLGDLPVVEARYTAGPVISALIGRPVYYPTMGHEGSWCRWSRTPFTTEDEALAGGMAGFPADRSVLFTSHPVPASAFPGAKLSPIACANGGMIDHEDGCATLVERR